MIEYRGFNLIQNKSDLADRTQRKKTERAS